LEKARSPMLVTLKVTPPNKKDSGMTMSPL
jgi:hypothetical protein